LFSLFFFFVNFVLICENEYNPFVCHWLIVKEKNIRHVLNFEFCLIFFKILQRQNVEYRLSIGVNTFDRLNVIYAVRISWHSFDCVYVWFYFISIV